MNARSDDVPDFYGTEPCPGDDLDMWGTKAFDSCWHAAACLYAAWWVAERCADGEDPDDTARDALTDGHCCASCGLYEPRGRA